MEQGFCYQKDKVGIFFRISPAKYNKKPWTLI